MSNTAIVPLSRADLPPYDKIPLVFRNQNEKWNKLGWNLVEQQWPKELRFVPRKGKDPERTFNMATEIAKNDNYAEFWRAAAVAWCLWSGFENFYYQYD
jgi:hypothetical protein